MGLFPKNSQSNLPAGDFNENTFEDWFKKTPYYSQYNRVWGEQPDLNPPDYNYRAAYIAGAKPEIDSDDVKKGEPMYHWDSRFKSDNHTHRFVNGIDTRNNEMTDITDYLKGLFGGPLLRKEDYGYDK